jgi:hypothetical protein
LQRCWHRRHIKWNDAQTKSRVSKADLLSTAEVEEKAHPVSREQCALRTIDAGRLSTFLLVPCAVIAL